MSCLDNVEVMAINKYRSTSKVNENYDRARVVLDLQFPRDLALLQKLKSQLKSKEIKGA